VFGRSDGPDNNPPFGGGLTFGPRRECDSSSDPPSGSLSDLERKVADPEGYIKCNKRKNETISVRIATVAVITSWNGVYVLPMHRAWPISRCEGRAIRSSGTYPNLYRRLKPREGRHRRAYFRRCYWGWTLKIRWSFAELPKQ
jgi:hypothetical protein